MSPIVTPTEDWTIQTLKEYLDAKFQTLVQAAADARTIADEARHNIQTLKEYTDSKFQTLVQASSEARATAERASAEARVVSDRTLEEARNVAERVTEEAKNTAKETLRVQETFLTKEDYVGRHESIESKINKLSETPWTSYISAVAVLLVIIGGFWGMVANRLESLERQDTEERVTLRKTSEDFERRIEANMSEIKGVEYRIDRLDTPLSRLVQQIGQRQSLIGDRMFRVEGRLDLVDSLIQQFRNYETRGGGAGHSPFGHQVSNMQLRLDVIESAVKRLQEVKAPKLQEPSPIPQ